VSEHPLDSQIWHSLAGPHSQYSVGSGEVRMFRPEVAPAAGLQRITTANLSALAAMIPVGESIVVQSAEPFAPPREFEMLDSHPLLLMVAHRFRPFTSSIAVRELSPADMPAMKILIDAAQPGPLLPGAFLLGRFVGVMVGDALVAIAGDRLRPPGYIEVCTVCSHPEFRGHGFAKAAVSAIGEAIVAEGAKPYLAVVPENVPAVRLYQSLGFEPERPMYFNLMKRVA
jgi:ribosomal protein S18 acetylase RimI-like enzyme